MTAQKSIVGPRLAVGVFTLSVGRVMGAMVALLSWTVLVRNLQPAAFGILQLATSIFVYAELAADLGTSITAAREVAAGGRARVAMLAGARFSLAAPVAITMAIAAVILGLHPAHFWLVIWLAIALLVGSMNYSWLLRGEQRASRLALVDVLPPLGLLLVAWLFVASPDDLVWAGIAIAMSAVAGTLGSVVLGGITFADAPRFGRHIFRTIGESWRLGIAGLAIAVYYSIDSIMLALLTDTASVGLYGAAYRLVLPWLAIAGMVGGLLLPALVGLRRDRTAEIGPLLQNTSRFLLALAVPVAVGTTVLAETIIENIYGAEYAASAVVLSLLIWSVVTVFANAPYAFLLLAESRDHTYMRIVLSGAALNVVVNIFLIPIAGIVGAAIATLVAEVLVLAAIIWVNRPDSLAVFRVAVAAMVPALAMGVAMYPLRQSILAVPFAVIIYVGLSFVTNRLAMRAMASATRSVWRGRLGR